MRIIYFVLGLVAVSGSAAFSETLIKNQDQPAVRTEKKTSTVDLKNSKTMGEFSGKMEELFGVESISPIREELKDQNNTAIQISSIEQNEILISTSGTSARVKYLGFIGESNFEAIINGRKFVGNLNESLFVTFTKLKELLERKNTGIYSLFVNKAFAVVGVDDVAIGLAVIAAISLGYLIGSTDIDACKVLKSQYEQCQYPNGRTSLKQLDLAILTWARNYKTFATHRTWLFCSERDQLKICLKNYASQLKQDIGVEGVPVELRSVFDFPENVPYRNPFPPNIRHSEPNTPAGKK